ncbi:MAG: methyltransferase domain-containing protein [Bacillota bacterium]
MSNREFWNNHWAQLDLSSYNQRDPLSYEILQALLDILDQTRGKKVLEAGSGSGKVSMWLGQLGAEPTLVDYAPSAAELARRAFATRRLQGQFLVGDIRQLPLPDKTFDLAWNAGVLEHMSSQDQTAALREMARVTRSGGAILVMSPNAACFPYRLGKYWAEANETWAWGDEQPVVTHRPMFERAGLTLVREFSIAQGTGLDFLYPLGSQVMATARQWFVSLSPEERAAQAGYLLCAVGRKETKG